MPNPSLGGPNLGGGPFNGYSPRQTITSTKDGEQTAYRRVLRNSWNAAMLGPVNGKNPVVTPFRAVNALGDFLGRLNYSCGGPNPTNASKPGRKRLIGSIPQQCDGNNIEVTSCNPKFVPDSSDYVRFKKLSAINRTYNDLGYGGANNGEYVPLMHVRRR
jgi:hypothetical protein